MSIFCTDHRIPHRTYGRPKSAEDADTSQDKRKHFLDKRASRVSRPAANSRVPPESLDDAPHEELHDRMRDLLPNFPPKPLDDRPNLSELIQHENHRGAERDHHLTGRDRDNQHGVHRHMNHEVEEEEGEEMESNKLR